MALVRFCSSPYRGDGRLHILIKDFNYAHVRRHGAREGVGTKLDGRRWLSVDRLDERVTCSDRSIHLLRAGAGGCGVNF